MIIYLLPVYVIWLSTYYLLILTYEYECPEQPKLSLYIETGRRKTGTHRRSARPWSLAGWAEEALTQKHNCSL